MRTPTVLLVCFLLLLFTIDETQGIRLGHGLTSVEHQRINEEKESNLIQASGRGVIELVLCKDGYCSGKSRKLMTETITTSSTTAAAAAATTTTTKNEKMGRTQDDPKSKRQASDEGVLDRNEENLTVKSSQTSDHRVVVVSNRYPDIIDIAGMDYSSAKRKPPIHN